MKKLLKNLKTSDKITLSFSLFTFFSLFVLLIAINITYFCIWYADQKAESMYDMNINYNSYTDGMSESNIEAFKEYIFQKDTIIIPHGEEEFICSPGVSKKIHDNLDLIKGKFLYKSEGKTYFIFSQNYPSIWEVKILFDTTSYVKSQIIIIKLSLVIIFLSLFFSFFFWKKVSSYVLKNLKNISEKAKKIDIESDFEPIEINWNPEDEINILADTINKSFSKIQNQTSNLKQFITDVSHEFKTPLMVINSEIDVYNKKLEKKVLGEEEWEKLLEKIKEKTNKLNRLLETFLLLSRIENGIETLDKKDINVWNHLQDITKNIIFWIESELQIHHNIVDEVIIKWEEGTLSLIVENLISNAMKFYKNNEAPRIEIGCNENSIWIEDNVVWIKEEDIEHIFDKFYRADTGREWFWVGLFITARIIELYKWSIEVSSERWKKTRFTIKF